MKILLIEDDDSLIALLTRSLSSQHHIVDAVKDGEMGWTYASTFDYDSIVLDIMLPKLDGISLCKKLRSAGYTTPIMLLTSQDNTTAKVQGLDAGADDYMVKPFDLAELTARVRALFRRGSTNPLPLLSWGDLLFNPSTCEVTYDGLPLTLTTKEYDLLELFLRESDRVFSSEEIIDRLWSSDAFPSEATVRSHLRRLRHKLYAAGAPPDTIATIHGRGYYLKSLQSTAYHHPSPSSSVELCQDKGLDAKSGNDLASKCEDDERASQSDRDRQYLAFLKETWVATKPQCLVNLAQLQAIIDRLVAGDSNYLEQQQAHQQAHKFAGTLGMFYLQSAMEIARHMEKLLARPTLLTPIEAATLPALASELARSIEEDPFSQTIEDASAELPLLILVALDSSLSQTLQTKAQDRGFQNITLSTLAAAESYLANGSETAVPTVVLVSFAKSQESYSLTSSPLFDFIRNVHQRFPDWSVLVLGERDDLNDRLAVVRHGGKFLGTTTLSAEQIFMATTSLLQPVNSTTKVMVVDDDLDWLRALPKLLQPWGLKVTTLADPQQFWLVLQVVQPDVLILDVKMPEINGLELCQVLRSDPHWQHLPILFLSATNDLFSQQAAFSVGADDYLCKPIGGGELAQRIRHRLARLQGHAELSGT